MLATTTTNATATPNKPAIEFAGSLAVLAACICLVPLLARYAAPLDVWLFYAFGIAAGFGVDLSKSEGFQALAQAALPTGLADPLVAVTVALAMAAPVFSFARRAWRLFASRSSHVAWADRAEMALAAVSPTVTIAGVCVGLGSLGVANVCTAGVSDLTPELLCSALLVLSPVIVAVTVPIAYGILSGWRQRQSADLRRGLGRGYFALLDRSEGHPLLRALFVSATVVVGPLLVVGFGLVAFTAGLLVVGVASTAVIVTLALTAAAGTRRS